MMTLFNFHFSVASSAILFISLIAITLYVSNSNERTSSFSVKSRTAPTKTQIPPLWGCESSANTLEVSITSTISMLISPFISLRLRVVLWLSRHLRSKDHRPLHRHYLRPPLKKRASRIRENFPLIYPSVPTPKRVSVHPH